ncbi:MAG: VWA domain-containing protein [bacterium]
MPRFKYSFIICMLLLLTIYFIQVPFSKSQLNINDPYGSSSGVEAEKILIILDSSYSMTEKINGERKIDIARKAINEVLRKLPQNVWVGLRVYGHSSSFFGINDCKASELKVPIGPNNQYLISNELLKIKPVGWTPISYSIRQAVEHDFNGLAGKKRIILVSDGMETCDGSPCDYAVSLVRNKIDLKIDVIGFDLSDYTVINQLKCTALATKGKFYTANTSAELSDSLSKSLSVSKEVEGKILRKN